MPADEPRIDAVRAAVRNRRRRSPPSSNDWLASVDAETRVRWALENLPGAHVLSSSFGAQAAVSLHLVTRQSPTSR